jgi:hypothetical protein
MALLGGDPSQNFVTLYSATALAASASSEITSGVERYTTAMFQLEVTSPTGTSETLDVYIQTLLPDGVNGAASGTWQDIVHFAQVTTTASHQICWFVSGGSNVAAIQTAALAAGTVKAIGLGSVLRVRAVITGTNPAYATVQVLAHFYT